MHRCRGLGGDRLLLRRFGGNVRRRDLFNRNRRRSRDAFDSKRRRGSGLTRNLRNSSRVLNDGNRLGISSFARVITLDSLFFQEAENVVEHKVAIRLFSQEKGLHKFTPRIRVI